MTGGELLGLGPSSLSLFFGPKVSHYADYTATEPKQQSQVNTSWNSRKKNNPSPFILVFPNTRKLTDTLKFIKDLKIQAGHDGTHL